MKIELTPIGYVKNSRKDISDDFWGEVVSEIELTEKFSEDSLKGITEFSHAEVVFYFHKADESKVITGARHPRGNSNWPECGVFAQHVKDRPNHIGLTIVKILSTAGSVLSVKGLDAIDGTPILDIKPVVREFLPREDITQPEWVSELMKDYWK